MEWGQGVGWWGCGCDCVPIGRVLDGWGCGFIGPWMMLVTTVYRLMDGGGHGCTARGIVFRQSERRDFYVYHQICSKLQTATRDTSLAAD